mmetsp:Transcript_6518/g.21781  ORF Transcript_6518/g.21781 Transcript_6518/m.21781 type:complete len:262 (-) Transcript_6518:86-871(-)|eukprot:CAMPEP_0170155714 /NCGR_PEP_ID=MMETSP0033_2-20121228/61364_1 /TAXON_ID=195969 /ORGANISM="Dolichomastix tenuilepis, Strain CCMP3274" /LENGTH=261 /DNA_ID=CAMNT_0010393043 /DNA_START=67 /DNA_END=852 /DNA_ORIENTATION=-
MDDRTVQTWLETDRIAQTYVVLVVGTTIFVFGVLPLEFGHAWWTAGIFVFGAFFFNGAIALDFLVIKETQEAVERDVRPHSPEAADIILERVGWRWFAVGCSIVSGFIQAAGFGLYAVAFGVGNAIAGGGLILLLVAVGIGIYDARTVEVKLAELRGESIPEVSFDVKMLVALWFSLLGYTVGLPIYAFPGQLAYNIASLIVFAATVAIYAVATIHLKALWEAYRDGRSQSDLIKTFGSLLALAATTGNDEDANTYGATDP